MSLLQEIVEKGDGIYRAKYKRDCQQRYFGHYIAIDVQTGDGFIAASAAAAIASGQSAGKPGALFRLIRIGYKGGGNPTPDQDRLQGWREPHTALRRTARAHLLTVEAPNMRGRVLS
jgi:hypothetical protein